MRAEMEFLIAKKTISGEEIKKCNRRQTPFWCAYFITRLAVSLFEELPYAFGQNKVCRDFSFKAGLLGKTRLSRTLMGEGKKILLAPGD